MINLLQKIAEELGLVLGVTPVTEEVRVAYPWAESVIVAAISYLPPECEAEDDRPRGWVARVARGADYHNVLRGKLSQLAELVRSQHPEARLEVCVDTCPLPERKLAVLAGIAWRGKSGNVFVEGCGSWCVLGEIVTDLTLPVSQPLDIDRCGECDLCMRACPAGAITAPYAVDRNRCLSSLTQTSSISSPELRRLMGNRIYGCDICQEVCPQNRGIGPSLPEFAEETFPGKSPELVPLISMSPSRFKDTVKGSSIGWIRRTRIRRNAAIAAGNMRCEPCLSALVEMLEGENPVLRATAAWALGEIGTVEAVAALNEALERERDDAVVEEIRAATSNKI